MDCRTGEIYEFDNEEEKDYFLKEFNDQYKRELVQLDEKEVQVFRELEKPQRKNRMRNKPCPCGSGKKFKHCCWSIYS